MEFDWTISVPVVISLATLIFAWLRTRRADVDERFTAGIKRMAALELRIQHAEQLLELSPGKEDIHRVELLVSEMAGDLKAMAASQRSGNDLMRRLEKVVTRHEEHLLDGAKK